MHEDKKKQKNGDKGDKDFRKIIGNRNKKKNYIS